MLGSDLGETLFAVGGGHDGIALHGQEIGEQLDVLRRVVHHQDFRGRAHAFFPPMACCTVSSRLRRLTGFSTKPLNPAFTICCRSCCMTDAVTATTGIAAVAESVRSAFSASMPL